MTAPIALTSFAVLLALLGPRLLIHAGWVQRAPRIGIAAWQALSVSLVLTVILAGAALALPVIPWTTDLAVLIRACAMVLRAQYSTPGGAAVSASGAVLALTVLTRAGWCVLQQLHHAHRDRRRHLIALTMIARPDPATGTLIIDHPTPAAYCLPGPGHHIVLTTSTLAALDHNQLDAVLAHEHAHLHGHHHLILAGAAALHRAFPGIPAFRHAHDQIVSLIEMLADDIAAHRADRLTVATALVRLGERATAPTVALGAAGTETMTRIQRLVAAPRPLQPSAALLALTVTAAILLLPLSLAAAPASAAGTMPPCRNDLTASAPAAAASPPTASALTHA